MFSLTEKIKAIDIQMFEFDTDFRITLDDAELITFGKTPDQWAYNVYNLLADVGFNIEDYRKCAKIAVDDHNEFERTKNERW